MIGGDSLYDLENLFKIHDEYEIDNSVCNNTESGFGRVSTLDPTYLDNVQSNEIFDKSGFGEVMTLVNVNPTILKSVNFACMWIVLKIFYVIAILLSLLMIPHVIIMREENMVVEIFLLPIHLSLLLFLSSSLHMLVFSCYDNLFAYKMPMHRKYVRLRCVCHVFYDAIFCSSILLSFPLGKVIPILGLLS